MVTDFLLADVNVVNAQVDDVYSSADAASVKEDLKDLAFGSGIAIAGTAAGVAEWNSTYGTLSPSKQAH